jgi:hypothetical protein|tara:strand:- start:132 stop:1568 length:1437 start_codon:yes stop_codon:yes gene_type:complete
MKKFLLVLFFTLFISATPDSENLNITIERKEESTIVISWNVLYEEFDTITLNILHEEKTETYNIPLSEGSIEICCYENEVTVTINVKVTKVIQLSNEDCAADSCISFEREEFQNQISIAAIPTTTTTSTTTTSTTTTTIPPPPPPLESTSFLNIEITNELITSIPLFDDIDLTDQEKNSIAFIMTTLIIVLFYLVLLLQEWFNKILTEYRVKLFRKDSDITSKSKLLNYFKILFALTMTAFLIGYVEEGASLVLDLENLAVFLAAFVGLVSVTFFYEGVEGLIEKFIFKQKVRFRWAPQAVFFALISTLAFIYFKMPIGFIFGFIASSYILNKRPIAKLSPKFYSSVFLSAAGFGFFYLTSLPVILDSSVFTAIAAISYLMCIEGVLLKALPGGGNELLESLNDSTGPYKVFPLLSFLLGLWLFIRILIVSPDSEFSNLQQDLLSMGSFSLTFGLMLIGYMISILIIGFFIKVKGRNE